MRISTLALIFGAAALPMATTPAVAQISGSLRIGGHGAGLTINSYDASRYGDWHTAYRHWTPVTVYYANGQYYNHSVRGSRAVAVYRSHNDYFLPPRDQAWNGFDHRYNYRRRPNDDDYNHVHSGS
ncbi:MAG TPA: hypothetical protein VGL65_04640 [Gemmatimonadales bacterium]